MNWQSIILESLTSLYLISIIHQTVWCEEGLVNDHPTRILCSLQQKTGHLGHRNIWFIRALHQIYGTHIQQSFLSGLSQSARYLPQHSCACQVPMKHGYSANLQSANYCIFPTSIAMKNSCFHQISYGKEDHQCKVSTIQLPLHWRMILRYTSMRKMGFHWHLGSLYLCIILIKIWWKII